MRLDAYANPDNETILEALGIKADEVPRFRGAMIEDGKILIHTRSGGGNRDCLKDGNAMMAANQYYIEDADDEFDCTYANFWFCIPDSLQNAESIQPKSKT